MDEIIQNPEYEMLLERLKKEYPQLQFGYYNRTKENFYPPDLEKSWPIR